MSKQQSLKGKVIWITGASSGLGQAMAVRCASLGARLILMSRRMEELQKVQLALHNSDQHLCVAADLCEPDQVLDAYAQVMQHFSRVDWLINNAGISQRALIADTSMQTERKIMEVDYFSQIFLTKTLLPSMLSQGAGQIVFVSSVAGLLGTQYRASYSAAKAAIHMWANSLRAEVAEQGIQVSVVFPGFVQTNVSFNALNGAGEAQGHQDEAIANGLTSQDFAEQVVQALLAQQEYIVVAGAKEKVAVLLNRLSPRLLYRMIRKAKVK